MDENINHFFSFVFFSFIYVSAKKSDDKKQ